MEIDGEGIVAFRFWADKDETLRTLNQAMVAVCSASGCRKRIRMDPMSDDIGLPQPAKRMPNPRAGR